MLRQDLTAEVINLYLPLRRPEARSFQSKLQPTYAAE